MKSELSYFAKFAYIFITLGVISVHTPSMSEDDKTDYSFSLISTVSDIDAYTFTTPIKISISQCLVQDCGVCQTGDANTCEEWANCNTVSC